MLHGEQVLLRAFERADVETVTAFGLDPVTWRLADDGPYVPTTVADALKRFDAGELHKADDAYVPFVIDVGGEPVGGAALWGINLHNRRAHVGMALGPGARGRGYGTDALRVLLRYAFLDRGLNRVQIETLATNRGALAAAARAGFVQEGVARQDAWVEGRFVDQVVLSVLAGEWDGSPG